MNGYSLITEEELAARLRVSRRTISRVLSRLGDRLGEKQGVFRYSKRTLRFDPELAVPAISKAYREHSRAKASAPKRTQERKVLRVSPAAAPAPAVFEQFARPSELLA